MDTKAPTLKAPTIADSSFHLIKSEYAGNSIRRGLDTGRLTERDAALIREFISELQSCNNISMGRTNKLVYTLVGWRRFISEFEGNTINDIYAGIATIKTAKSERGTPFKQNTISDFVTIIRQFYIWLIENNHSEIPEKKITRLKTPPKDHMTKEASDILTPGEITDIMNACSRSMDRAIVMMLYEGGFRVGEIGTLAWKDVVFDKHGVIVNVDFKTGKPRYIRLVMAAEHLAKWRSDYPYVAEGDHLVFITERKTALTHGSIQKQLQRIAARAGVKKHITPHVFRHSRITHLIKEGVSESVIKLMMWGSINTAMFQTYAHLTGQDIDSEILRSYGIASTKKKEELRLEPRQCQHCQTINSPTSRYCATCGQSLSEEAGASVEKVKSEIASDPEIMKALFEDMFNKKLEEMRESGGI